MGPGGQDIIRITVRFFVVGAPGHALRVTYTPASFAGSEVSVSVFRPRPADAFAWNNLEPVPPCRAE